MSRIETKVATVVAVATVVSIRSLSQLDCSLRKSKLGFILCNCSIQLSRAGRIVSRAVRSVAIEPASHLLLDRTIKAR